METEEKTSYTLNHDEEEKEDEKNESYEPLVEEEAAVETDKMLSDDVPVETKKSTEALAEADETTALDGKTEAVEEKVNSTVPTKNRFMQLFERNKPKTEEPPSPPPPSVEAANGNGTTTVAAADASIEAPPKRFFPSIKLQNPFAKKTETETATPADPATKPNEASSSDEKKGENDGPPLKSTHVTESQMKRG